MTRSSWHRDRVSVTGLPPSARWMTYLISLVVAAVVVDVLVIKVCKFPLVSARARALSARRSVGCIRPLCRARRLVQLILSVYSDWERSLGVKIIIKPHL